MKNLKYYILSLILSLSSSDLLSQSIGVQLDRNQGKIESIYVKKDNIIFKLDSSNSNIENIYVFSYDSLSERFFYDPIYDFRPRRKLQLHNGVNYTLTHTAALITQRITGITFSLELLAQLYRLMISKLSIIKE